MLPFVLFKDPMFNGPIAMLGVNDVPLLALLRQHSEVARHVLSHETPMTRLPEGEQPLRGRKQ